MELTLFSSDSSGQYKKDIFNVIAAPCNSEYRFRYRAQYIDPTLHTHLRNNMLCGSRALIVFRANSDKQNVDPFLVPIRWATIRKSFFNNEICVIDFTINDYPEFNQEFKDASVSKKANHTFSKTFFEQEGRNNKYVLSYVAGVVSRTKCDCERQEAAWISIIQALKHHESFSDTSFFRTLLPAYEENIFPESFVIKESQYKEIEIWHFCSEGTKSKISELDIQCNTDYINPVSGTKDRIECRYDRVNYGFQAIKGRNDLKTQIVFRITNLDDNLTPDHDTETKICIPVTIKKRCAKRIIRAFLSFVGSVCIVAFSALVALELTCIPNWAYGLMLVIGAIASPISWLISSED